MKRIISIVLGLFLIVGCGGVKQDETIKKEAINAYVKKINDITSKKTINFTINGQLKVEKSEMVPESMNLMLNGEGKINIKDFLSEMKFDFKDGSNAGGNMGIGMYFDKEYVYLNMMGMWQKFKMSITEDNLDITNKFPQANYKDTKVFFESLKNSSYAKKDNYYLINGDMDKEALLAYNKTLPKDQQMSEQELKEFNKSLNDIKVSVEFKMPTNSDANLEVTAKLSVPSIGLKNAGPFIVKLRGTNDNILIPQAAKNASVAY
ncbi:MAG: hypothetical protein LBT75_05390 [Bacilli bacterium]|jgi:hypothetical protein|nr:hypothetical protein [Bacilli bacterium]